MSVNMSTLGFNMFYMIVGIFLVCVLHHEYAVTFKEEKIHHNAQSLGDDEVLNLARLSNMSHFEKVLDTILIPRVVGTHNHNIVKQYLIQSMKDLGWDVETDPFKERTPVFGTLKFENIIARLNPNARRFLVLACHYDSKYFREGTFVGATDSAVPCAMMINLGKVMKKQLESIKGKDDVSLKFIFFDGEEAFRKWGPRDSIYGARHLAEKWEKTVYPSDGRGDTNYLHRLDLLVLLDLLGSPDPVFYNYFPDTERWYRQLANAEERLAQLRQFERYSLGSREQRYFQQMSWQASIEDDHIPFQIRAVPILHIIPSPFPSVWHTEGDNRNAVDMATVENLNKILRVFVCEYLHIST